MKPALHFCLTMGFTLLASISSRGQTAPFPTKEYIDINNIKALHLVHGDMWWDPGLGEARCEFPKNSGKNIGFAGALWMAGYDNGTLKIAAQTYRQNGNDYWPGPLSSSTPISYNDSWDWAKIWKVNSSDISTYLSISNHTLSNTPVPILEWPAKGNPYAKGNGGVSLTIANDLAPFVDVNSDGVYDPLTGDYPAIKGDQMLWNIFNDNGPTHNETKSTAIGVEVRCQTYAYKRNSTIDNMIFYEYEITNKSVSTLDSFVMGFFGDMDLGYYLDDFIGFDSSRNLGIVYNGSSIDGTGAIEHYGDTIPMAGIRVLQWNKLDTCQVNTPSGSFMYYMNNSDMVRGNPSVDTQFNNYLRHRWRNGNHLAAPHYAPGPVSQWWTDGTGPGTPVKYVYNGDPQTNGWSECYYMHLPGDRRFIIAGDPVLLLPNQTEKISIALIASTKKYKNSCPYSVFSDIQAFADTAKMVYCNPLTPTYNSINDLSITKKQLKTYPNPANQNIYVQIPFNQNEQIQVYDGLGRNVHVVSSRKGNQIELNVEELPNGVYYIIYRSEDKAMSNSFIKN